ncbi:inorganic pyrophosphatase [Parathielavia appendiculata]|uniref:Inorganic pyrophosphatase n=1 Tax=Parathielavia appendiculata TaxID=2587402 RepID=A0AAN6TTF6_9PEZI|nr:inorganic pyrophosphatase [Parathielavia appendiculata]
MDKTTLEMELSYDKPNKSEYSVRRSGRPYTKDYRIFFERSLDKVPVSPFHDIPLYNDKDKGILNMVVEVPRWTNAKFEISRNESLNPIHQDNLDKKPRFVKNFFPYKGYIWNYGALPQTWEDPHHTTPETHTNGDNDPLDACEIGRAVACPGDVKQVKVLGILALLDQGETDWKVLVIDVRDPLAERLSDIADVEEHLPGMLGASIDWWRVYRVPDGQRGNGFGFGGRWLDRGHAKKVIGECEDAWKRLITGKVERGDISLDNTTLKDTPGNLDPDKVHLPPDEVLSPAPIEQDLEEWYYVDRDAVDAQKASLEGSCLHVELNVHW